MGRGPVSYQPGASFLHEFHPVTNTILVACFILAGYLASVEVRLFLLLILVVSAAATGVFRTVARAGIPILVPLLVGLMVIHGIVTEGDRTPLVKIGAITIWQDGVLSGLAFFGILAIFVLAGLIFVAVTHPKKLSVSLYQKGVPYKFGYVFVTALHLVPDLQHRARRILDSQQSRGLDTGGSFRNRIRALVALLSPLLISALISTQTRSLALEARGFSIQGPRSSLYSPVETPIDYVVRAVGVVGVLILAVWRFV